MNIYTWRKILEGLDNHVLVKHQEADKEFRELAKTESEGKTLAEVTDANQQMNAAYGKCTAYLAVRREIAALMSVLETQIATYESVGGKAT